MSTALKQLYPLATPYESAMLSLAETLDPNLDMNELTEREQIIDAIVRLFRQRNPEAIDAWLTTLSAHTQTDQSWQLLIAFAAIRQACEAKKEGVSLSYQSFQRTLNKHQLHLPLLVRYLLDESAMHMNIVPTERISEAQWKYILHERPTAIKQAPHHLITEKHILRAIAKSYALVHHIPAALMNDKVIDAIIEHMNNPKSRRPARVFDVLPDDKKTIARIERALTYGEHMKIQHLIPASEYQRLRQLFPGQML